MKKYEYNVWKWSRDRARHQIEQDLNMSGSSGWKVVGTYQAEVIGESQQIAILMMREVETPDPNAMPTISKWLILTGSLMMIIAWLIGKIP